MDNETPADATVVDTAPPADAPPADAPPADAPPETPIEPVAEVEAAVVDAIHTIEHRSFARASADEPMPVTTLTGN